MLVNTVIWSLRSVGDANVHQFRELIDVLIALILERDLGAVVLRAADQLLIDVRNLLQGVVGLLHIVGDSLVGLAAKRLDFSSRAIELLRQGLRGADRLALRRSRNLGLSIRPGRRS